jgi:hypothetical protein
MVLSYHKRVADKCVGGRGVPVDDCSRLVLLLEMPTIMVNIFQRDTLCFWQVEESKQKDLPRRRKRDTVRIKRIRKSNVASITFSTLWWC